MNISCHETWYTHPLLPAVKVRALGYIQVGSTATYTLTSKEKGLKKQTRPTRGTKGLKPESDEIGPSSNLKENINRHQKRGGCEVSHKSWGKNGYQLK